MIYSDADVQKESSPQQQGRPVQYKTGILGFLSVSEKDEIPKVQANITA